MKYVLIAIVVLYLFYRFIYNTLKGFFTNETKEHIELYINDPKKGEDDIKMEMCNLANIISGKI